VFLAIAKQAEMEAAAASGNSSASHVLQDGTTLMIPQGAEWVVHPGTNVTYHVMWAQDDKGALMVMDVVVYVPPVDVQAYVPSTSGVPPVASEGQSMLYQVPHPQVYPPTYQVDMIRNSAGQIPGHVPTAPPFESAK
jgi:hypothetical protein